MPEGPEIHAQTLKLRTLLEGHRAELECLYPPLASSLAGLSGQRMARVRAQGKAFLLTFEAGQTLYAHMQLYGRWQFHSSDKPPRTRRQLRLRFSRAGRSASLYSATDLELLEATQLASHGYLSRLGPDLLDPEVDDARLVSTLLDRRFQGRQLASLLLDQSFWAGVGNYLRSEILFCAGVAPDTRPRQLPLDQGRKLARSARSLALRSLRTGGLTNHPELVAPARKQGQSRRHYRHWVFAREGHPCWLCQQPVRKEEWNSRRLYRCSGCGGGGALASDFSDLSD